MASKTEKQRAATKRWQENNREKYLEGKRRSRLKLYHQMTIDDWENLWDEQCGLCYLCGGDLNRDELNGANIDHDHDCCPKGKSCANCRRGLTCNRCNRAIGFFDDDPDLMRFVADNLEAVMNR